MKVVIIGNGISGITAARYIRKHSNHDILVISAETKYFYSRTALMYVYMGHMSFEGTQPYENWFWQKNRIELKQTFIEKVDTDKRRLIASDGETITYDKLIIASGSKSNKFGWPGQDLKGVHGLYHYQDLENLERLTPSIKHAMIVGGGLIGIELGEMLHSRGISVTFLVREQSYWDNVLPPGESAMINRHIIEHGFELLLAEELKEILADENGRARAVVTNKNREIACQFVGLTAGVSPNIDFLKSSGIETARGVLVNRSFETNVKDVYAIGDCAQFREPPPGRRPIEQVWYTGKMHGQVVAQNVCGEATTYKPGPWFNSAKFLDIEYQTYGTVLPKLNDGEASLYWEHKAGKKAINIVYETENLLFKGINLMGIRARHEVFDHFLREGKDVEYVLRHLGLAEFDPEFFASCLDKLIAQYNTQNGKSLQPSRKRGVKAVLELLKF